MGAKGSRRSDSSSGGKRPPRQEPRLDPSGAPIQDETEEATKQMCEYIESMLARSPEYESLGRVGGGSSAVFKVRDRATGKLWTVKQRPSPQQCHNEVSAAAIYRAFGGLVPETHVHTEHGVCVLVQEFKEGRTLQQLRQADAHAAVRAEREVCRHFFIDCLLANWDVVGGRGGDNILVDPAGGVWRIDNAGTFSIRAQGGPKGSGWCPHVSELILMRDQEGGNTECAAVFKHLSDDDVAVQVAKLVEAGAAVFDHLPPADRDMCLQRVRFMSEYVSGGAQVGQATRPGGVTSEGLLQLGFTQDAVDVALVAADGDAEVALQILTGSAEQGAAGMAEDAEPAPAEESVQLLTAMGFDRECAIVALQTAGGSVERAVEVLSGT